MLANPNIRTVGSPPSPRPQSSAGGHGSDVSADGFQALPHRGMLSENVWLPTGNLTRALTLVSISSLGPDFGFQLSHRCQDNYTGTVGENWRHNFQQHLDIDTSKVIFYSGSGQTLEFIPDGSGGWKIDTSVSYHQNLSLENPSGTTWEVTARTSKTIWRFEGTALSGYPETAGRLIEIEDRYGSILTLNYTAGLLSSIEEPQGREILLTYTSGLLTGVEDPRSESHVLSYDNDDNLTSVSGPEGCITSFEYSDPTDHKITGIVDALGNRTRYKYTQDKCLESVCFPGGGVMEYSYDSEVSEFLGDGILGTFTSTKVVFPDRETFEYRFEANGNLWRVITPSGHTKRYFWSPQQQFLYCSEGFPLENAGYLGPYDNMHNRFTARTVNDKGDVIQSFDGAGLIDTYQYNSDGRVTVAHPGQANQGVQGNWPEYYGKDGVLLCSFEDDNSDIYRSPSYLNSNVGTAITNGDGSGGDLFTRANHNKVDVIDGRAPIEGDGSNRAGIGHWTHTSASGVFQFAINLDVDKSFNLSIYTHSADHDKDALSPLRYSEIHGRDLEIEVVDTEGTHTYRTFNNAPGVWITFPVKGTTTTPVRVTVTAKGDNDQPVISALAFDPYEDRRRFYDYDVNGNLTKVTDGLGQETTFTYNTDGTMASSTNARGKTTSFEYLDTHKNQTKVTDADSNVTTRTFDNNGNVLTVTDANTHVTTMTYDGKNRLLTTTNPLTHKTEFEYDGNGNTICITDAKLRETRFTYTAENFLATVTDPLGNVVTLDYDLSGRISSQTDPRGFVTRYYYDKDGCLSRVETPDGESTTFSYDSLNRLVALTGPNGNQDKMELVNLVGAANFFRNPDLEVDDPHNDLPSDWFCDFSYQETQETFSGGKSFQMRPGYSWSQSDVDVPAGAKLVTKAQVKPNSYLTFDMQIRGLDGAPTSNVNNIRGTEPGLWSEVSSLFEIPGDSQNSYGLPSIASFDAKWVQTDSIAGWLDDLQLYMLSTTYQVNREGQTKSMVTPDGAQTYIHRDHLHRIISREDAMGRRTHMTYDALDRIVSLTRPGGEVLAFTFDELGSMLSFTDERNKTTSFTYDDLNRLTIITFPDLTTESFAYDAVSNLTSYTDNKSQTKTFEYDDANQLTKVTYPDLSTVNFVYDEIGNVTSKTERNGDSTAFTYDNGNRLLTVVRTKGSGNTTPEWSHAFAYDESGNRKQLTSSSVEAWSTLSSSSSIYDSAIYEVTDYAGGRDGLGRMLGLKAWGADEVGFSYDIEGRRDKVTHSNGVETKVGFDIMSRPLKIETSSQGCPLLDVTYSYDKNSNRTKQITGQDTFDYKLSNDDQLLAECINRFVEHGPLEFVKGEVEGLVLTSNGVGLLPINDSFTGDELNCDRWRVTYANASSSVHPDTFPGAEIRQSDGLHMAFPRGYSARIHEVDVIHNFNQDYGLHPEDFYILVEHRVQLTGDFDVKVDISSLQGFAGTKSEGMLYISENASEAFDEAAYMKIALTHDDSLVVEASVGSHTSRSAPSLPVTVRLARVGSTVSAYFWDTSTSTWVTESGWSRVLNADPMWVGLASRAYNNAYISTKFKNFYHDATQTSQYVSSGYYTSAVYDPGRPVDWKSLAFAATEPSGTEVKFQLAVAQNEEGPWTYCGPDGTSGSYFTAASSDLMGQSYIGRYARYKAHLSGDGTDTPDLTEAEFGFSGSLASQFRGFEFDAAGNMTKKTVRTESQTTTETRTYNDLNQVTQNLISDGGSSVTWTFTYDNNGNMTSRSNGTDTYTYTWTVNNQLNSVALNSSTLVSYSYDSQSRLIQRVEGTTTTNFIWDGWDLLRKEKTGGVTETTEYLVPEGEVLAFKRSGTTYRLHGDALSSTQLVTDQNGDQVARFVYGAWGEILSETNTILGGFDARFVGGVGVRNDSATGLIYMRHRWYDVELQRFISRDPIGFDGGLNLYVYASNPMTHIDRTGLKPGRDPFAKPDFSQPMGPLSPPSGLSSAGSSRPSRGSNPSPKHGPDPIFPDRPSSRAPLPPAEVISTRPFGYGKAFRPHKKELEMLSKTSRKSKLRTTICYGILVGCYAYCLGGDCPGALRNFCENGCDLMYAECLFSGKWPDKSYPWENAIRAKP